MKRRRLQSTMPVSTFTIDEMCCATEERLIRNRLEGISGGEDLDFNLISRTLTVTHELPDEHSITSAIATLGMKAVPKGKGRAAVEPAVAIPFWRRTGTIVTAVSGVCAVAAETLAIALDEHHPAVRILAVLAVMAGGYETFPRAWASLKSFTFNIHFLMSVAALGAIVLGEWAEAGMVIFLFAVAELIESLSMERARRAISGLMELTPPRALTLRGLGWESVAVDDVATGEIVRRKPRGSSTGSRASTRLSFSSPPSRSRSCRRC